ncbi:hypothetical protein [Komagataeibacter sp. FNDCF1]|uniref:hypothetical protein n=1 Tax=Komagataeibacter sp. FNDCF1 TaxID=2878681 RepID=UPI001E2C4EBF|nr:hypothetical protein [Komagataeibacter sp. FNDCF1]MCE2564511.1 hypothetical protein [Komagataeibacter sp. FNDCF1]
MVRTHGRIWIGLLAWLLVQAGLLVGSIPVPAQARTPLITCTQTDEPQCMTAAAHATHMAHMHHRQPSGSETCCHVHAATDIPSPTTPYLIARPIAGNGAFIPHRQVQPAGSDRLPLLRPPRNRNA